MSDIVDRVMKLIALASSPNENEARTAAFKACELIREHKLQVTLSAHAAHVASAGRQPHHAICGRCFRPMQQGGACPWCAIDDVARQRPMQSRCVECGVPKPLGAPCPACSRRQRPLDRCKRCNRPSPNGDLCSRCSATHDPGYVIECKTCGAFVRGVSAQGVCDRASAAGFYTHGDETFCSRH